MLLNVFVSNTYLCALNTAIQVEVIVNVTTTINVITTSVITINVITNVINLKLY